MFSSRQKKMLRLLVAGLLLCSTLFAAADHASDDSSDGEADVCTQGVYDTNSCTSDRAPYLCRARLEARGQGTCISEGLCCCESRDESFSSSCTDGDICCDGGCCDPKKSFCCGGGCCDQESEVCCGGQCVAQASNGITVAVPVVINLTLALLFYCLVWKATKDLRAGRFTTFMLLAMIFGAVQVVVVLSAWDCSTAVKVIVGIGAAEVGLGLLVVAVRMVQAKKAGQGLFAAFTMERFIILAVNQQGEVLGVAVADKRTMQVAKGKLGGESSYGNVPQVMP